MFQLLPIASSSVTGHHWEESGSIFFIPLASGFYKHWWDLPWATSSPV